MLSTIYLGLCSSCPSLLTTQILNQNPPTRKKLTSLVTARLAWGSSQWKMCMTFCGAGMLWTHSWADDLDDICAIHSGVRLFVSPPYSDLSLLRWERNPRTTTETLTSPSVRWSQILSSEFEIQVEHHAVLPFTVVEFQVPYYSTVHPIVFLFIQLWTYIFLQTPAALHFDKFKWDHNTNKIGMRQLGLNRHPPLDKRYCEPSSGYKSLDISLIWIAFSPLKHPSRDQ